MAAILQNNSAFMSSALCWYYNDERFAGKMTGGDVWLPSKNNHDELFFCNFAMLMGRHLPTDLDISCLLSS